MLGETVGSYRITDRIGEGGMGMVYLAEHSLLGRTAAIKVLHAENTHQAEIVERFFNEARSASAIRHPGIVEIFDFGYAQDDSAYIVMEHLAGESLRDRLDQSGTLEPTRAVGIARQIASALQAAHDQEIIHRDLKPDNIFLVPDPEVEGGERAKILDFGIAKLAANRGALVRTQTGQLFGTPAYMAPEQCRGAGQIDSRADLYALGCILYEMVCGQPPFMAEGGGEILAAHIYEEPPAPRELAPATPEPLENAILQLLEKDANSRFSSASAAAQALRHVAGMTGQFERVSRSVPATPAPVPNTPVPADATSGTGPTEFPESSRAEPRTLGPAPSSSVSSSIRRSAQRRRRVATGVVVASLGGIAALAVGGFVVAGGGGAETANGEDVEAAASESDTADDEATDSAREGEAPEEGAEHARGDAEDSPGEAVGDVGMVVIELDSEPQGADVTPGDEDEPIGETPLEHEVTPAEDELEFELSKENYEDASIAISPEEETEHLVELERETSPRERPGTRRGSGERGGEAPQRREGASSPGGGAERDEGAEREEGAGAEPEDTTDTTDEDEPEREQEGEGEADEEEPAGEAEEDSDADDPDPGEEEGDEPLNPFERDRDDDDEVLDPFER